jgi:dephospho-CoA kinase
MKLFGITGGVGMGKSTTAALLERRGIPVIDTDHLARQLVEPGQPALEEIFQTFGPSVMEGNGALDRKELARLVFADESERAKLEAILHPRIAAAWAADVEKWRSAGAPAGSVVIPLLYETRAESRFSAVICVACSRTSQLERLRERGWTGTEIRQRVESQWPVEEKISRADYVIWTDGTLESHAAQLDKILLEATPALAAAR